MKTRYAKPFESVQVEIPYETGMSPYSGLTDMLEAKSLLTKEGNSLVYTFADKKTIKQFRKAWERNEDGCLDKVMKELSSNVNLLSTESKAVEQIEEVEEVKISTKETAE
jgi:hypothetical protein